MLNKLVLVKAIEDRENGVMPNFSNIELNQGVDLVLFKNYNVDTVCKMTSDELESALYEDEYLGEYNNIENESIFTIEEDLTGEIKELYKNGAIQVKMIESELKNEAEADMTLPLGNIGSYIGKVNADGDVMSFYKYPNNKIYITVEKVNGTFESMKIEE